MAETPPTTGKLYKFAAVFAVDLGLKSMDDIMERMGDPGRIEFHNALEIKVTQTLPVVPTEEHLQAIADIIVESYQTDDIVAHGARFLHYDYFREIDAEELAA